MNLSATQIQLAEDRCPIGKALKFVPSLTPVPLASRHRSTLRRFPVRRGETVKAIS
jgi:hypothetical protein